MNTEQIHQDFPVLAIAYDDVSRSVMANNLASLNVKAVPCSTFCEAESYALQGHYRGILVDLMAMIKAKDEEKDVAYSLSTYYPTLRVKTMGMMVVPMAMGGDPKQDKSLNDFLARTCVEFIPRTLRASERKDICIQTYIGIHHGLTLNISWGGAFISDIDLERFPVGKNIAVTFTDFGLDVESIVARTQPMGQHRPEGIGVKFKYKCPALESRLFPLLKSVNGRRTIERGIF
jgi:hypothetical protein